MRLGGAIALLSVGTPYVARAEWPIARHDVQRTGVATGHGELSSPAPYWRYYLGGSVTPYGVIAYAWKAGVIEPDVVAIVEGGALVGRDLDGSVLWRTPGLGINVLRSAADLNGDGTVELISHSKNQVFVVDGRTGIVVWAQRSDEMGSLGIVYVADVDHDGRPDIYVQECGSCSVVNGAGAIVYGFSTGFVDVSRTQVFAPSALTSPSLPTVLDMDGDGHAELLKPTPGPDGVTGRSFTLVDLGTGATLADSADLGIEVQDAYCIPATLDDTPGEELVCVRGFAGGAGHHVFALQLDTTGAVKTLLSPWITPLGEVDGGVSIGADFVADMDGSGGPEIALTGTLGDGSKSAYVIDSSTGTVVGSLAGRSAAGMARLEPDRSLLLTTSTGESGLVEAWTLDRSAASPLVPRGTLAGAETLSYPAPDLERRAALDRQLVATDVDGDGANELVTASTPDGTGSPREIRAHRFGSGEPTLVGSVAVDPAWAWLAPSSSPAGAQVMVASRSGALHLLGQGLGGSTEPAFQFGGFSTEDAIDGLGATPVSGSFSTGSPATIVTRTSSSALVALDATFARFDAPPRALWTLEHARAAGIVQSDTGGPVRVVFEHASDPAKPELLVVDAAGEPVWDAPRRVSEADGATLRSDILPASLDADGVMDFIAEWSFGGGAGRTISAFSGKDGAPLWATELLPPYTQASGASIADWNGDGVDDVILQAQSTYVVSGVDGAILETGPMTLGYGMLTVYDVDPAAEDGDELILHATPGAFRVLEHETLAATASWPESSEDRPVPYGSVVACPGAPTRFVQGSEQAPATLRIWELDGPAVGSYASLTLAGGSAFGNEATAAGVGVRVSRLSSVSVRVDDGGSPTVFAGSRDGWLYLVDPCGSSLSFARDLGAPLGALSFSDLDGDGRDELLASAADGYLYGLKDAPLPSPAYVWDLDPAHPTEGDIQESTARGTLAASWDPVAGATGYELRVVPDAGATCVECVPWYPVGLVTSATLSDLSFLEIGARYHVAVRALLGARPAIESVSDGVTLRAEDSGQCTSNDGCPAGQVCRSDGFCDHPVAESAQASCGVGPGTTTSTDLALWVTGAVIAAARRRRKRGGAPRLRLTPPSPAEAHAARCQSGGPSSRG